MTAKFLIETLNQTHNRKEFCCRVEALDKYFVEQVTQDIRRRVTVCYVAIETTTNKIAGYYTLAASGILLTDIPVELVKKLPRYPSVLVARLGRLAVDQNYRGQKLGSVLLWDAISRTLRSEIAVFALVVDAKDEQAEAFYRYHGFINFGSLPKQLMISLTKFLDK